MIGLTENNKMKISIEERGAVLMAKNKKELIREAAIKTFASRGYFSTTTDLIAEEAGVSVGTIYNYFDNKLDILEYICQVEYEKRKSYFEELKEQNIGPVDRIKKIIEKHFDEVKANPLLVKIILWERHNTRNFSYKKSGLRIFIKEAIDEGIESKKLREVNSEILSIAIFGSIESVMREYLESWEEEKSQPEIFDEALSEIIGLLNNGIVLTQV